MYFSSGHFSGAEPGGTGVRLAGFDSISNQPCDPGQITYSSSLSSASYSVQFLDTVGWES